MPKLRVSLPTRWWSRFIWIFVTYILATDLLPILLLLLINCSGYLPYSDRPGPGWQPPHLPSKEELSFFFGFAVSLGIPSLIYATAHSVLAVVYEFCSLPKWLVRVCGSITGFLSAGFLMAAAGWMIAISATGVYLAAGCGLLWGLFVLPSLVTRGSPPRPLFVRIGMPLLVFFGGVFYLIRPFLPHAPVPPLNIDLTRCNDSGTGPEVSLDRAWTDDSLIRRAGLADRVCHLEAAGQTGMTGDGANAITMHLLFLSPTNREVDVPVPKKGEALIIIDGNHIQTVPSQDSTSKEKLRILEKSKENGLSIKDDGYGRMDNWFWYHWSPQTGYGGMDTRLLKK